MSRFNAEIKCNNEQIQIKLDAISSHFSDQNTTPVCYKSSPRSTPVSRHRIDPSVPDADFGIFFVRACIVKAHNLRSAATMNAATRNPNDYRPPTRRHLADPRTPRREGYGGR